MRHLVFLAAFFLATFNNAFSAFAWSDLGHRVICQIAYEELKPEIEARVDALIAIDPKFRTVANGCTWPAERLKMASVRLGAILNVALTPG